jgi:hypothetical protein
MRTSHKKRQESDVHNYNRWNNYDSKICKTSLNFVLSMIWTHKASIYITLPLRSSILSQLFTDLKPPTEHQQCTHKIKKNIIPGLLINMKQNLSNPWPNCLLIGGGQLSGCSGSVVWIFPAEKRGKSKMHREKEYLGLVHCFSCLFSNSGNCFCNATPPKPMCVIC